MPLSFRQRVNTAKQLKVSASQAIKGSMKNMARKGITASVVYTSTMSAGRPSLSGSYRKKVFSAERSSLALYAENIRKLFETDPRALNSDDVRKVMEQILYKAKEDAPVDKRYIGKTPNKDISINFEMPSYRNLNERTSGMQYTAPSQRHRLAVYGRFAQQVSKDTDAELRILIKKDRKGEELTEGEKLILQNTKSNLMKLNIPNNSGWAGSNFSAEKIEFMKSVFSGGNNRERKRYLWYNKTDMSINSFKVRKGSHSYLGTNNRNVVVATAFTDAKQHGGEEELKRSGKYDRETHTISFDPTRLGTKYNYASIQHNNIYFDHGPNNGGPFFLYNAYSLYRSRLIDAIKSSIEDLNKRALKEAQEKEGKVKIKKKKIPKIKNVEVEKVSKEAEKDVLKTNKNLLEILVEQTQRVKKEQAELKKSLKNLKIKK